MPMKLYFMRKLHVIFNFSFLSGRESVAFWLHPSKGEKSSFQNEKLINPVPEINFDLLLSPLSQQNIKKM